MGEEKKALTPADKVKKEATMALVMIAIGLTVAGIGVALLALGIKKGLEATKQAKMLAGDV